MCYDYKVLCYFDNEIERYLNAYTKKYQKLVI